MDLPNVNPGEIIKAAHINKISLSLADLETLLSNQGATTVTDNGTYYTIAFDGPDQAAVLDALNGKADKVSTYTKTEVETALNGKADKTSTYTKTEADAMVGSATPSNILVQPGASDATAFPNGVDVIFT